jgi:hypothetical protein
MNGEQIWGIVRTVLAAVGGWAATKGYVSNELMTAVLGGLGTIFVAGWSAWSNKPSA